MPIVLMAVFIVRCSGYKEVPAPTGKQLAPSNIQAYHDPVEMKIAWVPYQNVRLTETRNRDWVVVEDDSAEESALPMIMITYPASGDTAWVHMGTKNALLGKLLKHTLMTQQPITRPYEGYFEQAQCISCHPGHVKVDFE